MVDMLKGQLINILLILEIIQWGLLALGIVLILAMGIWYYCRRKRLSSASIEPIIATKST
jgi:LPXTG-motif cell wall-anchored protein